MQQQLSTLCLTLDEAISGFILHLRTTAQPSTVEAYRIVLAELADYAADQRWPDVTAITARHIRQYLVNLRQRPRWFGKRDAACKPISASYYETIYRRTKRFFNWLIEEGEIGANPMARVPHPKLEERIIPVVTDRDFHNLLRLASPQNARTEPEKFRALRDTAVLWVLADTSVRREGITGMTIDDVDFDQGAITVFEKGRKERIVWVGHTASKALWRYVVARERVAQFTDALWVDASGRGMKPKWIYDMLKRLGERAGVPNLHPHRFRHTFATNMINENVSLPTLEHLGGWKRIPRTYLRNIGDAQARQFHQKASPADRLARALRKRT